jgi:hypothetical protein
MDSAKKQIDACASPTWAWKSCDTPTTGFSAQEISRLDNLPLSNVTIADTVTAAGSPYVISNVNWGTLSTATALDQAGKLSLNGKNADIIINGVSLVHKLDSISERLNILQVNSELEAEWDQLRELGEQYRQLEEQLRAKSAMWETLKTKTPSKPRS